MSKSQTVLIVGATGRTGSSIADALLGDPKFHVIASVRPVSASKPAVESLRARGAEIRIIDLASASLDEVVEHLKGADTVIATIVGWELDLQKPLIEASKRAGVKRFVPDDFATASVRGVRAFYDLKAVYHDLIKEIGLGYTFIDVGYWYQVILPVLDPTKPKITDSAGLDMARTIYGTGDVRFAITDLRDVGKFVARIISDERTLNKYVFAWSEQPAQKEVIALAERVTGKQIPINHTSAEEVKKRAQETTGVQQAIEQYIYGSHIRGDNTIENAKKEEYGGALDARELYPDLKVISLEEYAKEYYSS